MNRARVLLIICALALLSIILGITGVSEPWFRRMISMIRGG
jgi:hypothetical protein